MIGLLKKKKGEEYSSTSQDLKVIFASSKQAQNSFLRQNYKFYAKKRKNTKPKEWPQQNRVEKIEQEK